MTALPIDIMYMIVQFHAHPTVDIIRPWIHKLRGQATSTLTNVSDCLIFDDSANTNSNAYEMYAISQCIRHKRQVRYLCEVKTLHGVLYNFLNSRSPSEGTHPEICR